jgi:hypothetical protein
VKPLADLVMGEIFAPLQSFLAEAYGLDDASLFLEMAPQNRRTSSSALQPCLVAECVSASSPGMKCTSRASEKTG